MTTAGNTDMDELKAEVERLQQKLEEAHGGDYNALARAYRSLLQHIQALQIEAQIMKKHIDALDVDVMSPDHTSNQLGAVGAVAAVAVAANRLFKGRNLATLRLSIYAGGAIFLGIRFTAAGLSRLGSLLGRNRQRKRRLQHDWDTLTERIRIMDSVSRWEGQDPALAPPPARSASEGTASTSGWVDVAGGEGEGAVAYPKPYSPAAAQGSDSDEGQIAYPQGGDVAPAYKCSSGRCQRFWVDRTCFGGTCWSWTVAFRWSYNQVFQTSPQEGAGEKKGVVHYPLADAGSRELPRPGHKKGGGQERELPSAPPLPEGPEAAAHDHRQAQPQEVPAYHGR